MHDIPAGMRRLVFRLMILFRLAVLLNRSRSPVDSPNVRLVPSERGLEIRFPRKWLENNPLTRADLEQEKTWLRAAGFKLRVRTLR